MEIAFTVDAAELNRAIGVASIVTPQSPGGYLLNVRHFTCDVYSRDGRHEARSSFEVRDVVGEGGFVLPAEAISGLSYITGDVHFLATESEQAFKVKYTFGESGLVEQASIDPRGLYMFERDVTAAQEAGDAKVFSIKSLQFALATVKSFLPKSNENVDKEEYRTVRIFGDRENPKLAEGNGYMLASNSKEICYFQCSAFLDKDLSLPAQHLAMVEAFLAKSSGAVEVFQSETKAYVANSRGDVLGWPRHAVQYDKFGYVAKTDDIVLEVSPERIIPQLKMMRANLPKDKLKIRMHFDPRACTLWFSSVGDGKTLKSNPVAAGQVSVGVTEPIAANVNVQHLLHMFEGIRGNHVEFRVKIIPADQRRPRDRFMFRTIDGFLLSDEGTVVGGLVEDPPADVQYPPEGAYECRVTRFAPGID